MRFSNFKESDGPLSFALLSRYLGHPLTGFFLVMDFFTASFQSPSIFNRSGLGPRFSGAFFAVLGMRHDRRFVHEPLSFRRLDRQHSALSVIQLTPIPDEIELPEIAVQVFTANVVIHANDAATN